MDTQARGFGSNGSGKQRYRAMAACAEAANKQPSWMWRCGEKSHRCVQFWSGIHHRDGMRYCHIADAPSARDVGRSLLLCKFSQACNPRVNAIIFASGKWQETNAHHCKPLGRGRVFCRSPDSRCSHPSTRRGVAQPGRAPGSGHSGNS